MQKPAYYASMRRTILVCMILLPFIPFVLMLYIGQSYFTASIQNGTMASMERIIGDHRHMIESFLAERRGDLEFIRNTYRFEQLSQPEELVTLFEYLRRRAEAFVDIGVFNHEGLHVAYTGPYELTGKIYKEADWFKEVMQRDYYISDIFLGFRKAPHFIIAISGVEKGEKWVLRATIDSLVFNDLVGKIRLGETGEAYILNNNGLLQTTRRSGGELMEKDEGSAPYLSYHQGIKTFIDQQGGKEYLCGATWMGEKQWLLMVRQDKQDAFKALRSATQIILIIAIACGGCIIIVAVYLTDYIIKRMRKMDKQKDQLAGQLVRAHRLAELGEMSAGFAHEINNPLQIMRSEQSLIEMNLDDLQKSGQLKESNELSEIIDSLNQIKLQITRCAEITQAILKFGRKTEPKTININLCHYIPEITEMIAKIASVNGIRIDQRIPDDIAMVTGDPGQLQQVLLNLYNNAIDAIIERHGASGGCLTIQAYPHEDQKVKIIVSDNGNGIPPENIKSIFSPFFTTKPVGKGTGLGLSVCYGIIDNMGGVLEVSSEVGVGTTFMITLDACQLND